MSVSSSVPDEPPLPISNSGPTCCRRVVEPSSRRWHNPLRVARRSVNVIEAAMQEELSKTKHERYTLRHSLSQGYLFVRVVEDLNPAIWKTYTMSGCNRLSGSQTFIAFNSCCGIILLSRCRSGSLSRICKPSTHFKRIALVEAEETLAAQRRDPTNPIRMGWSTATSRTLCGHSTNCIRLRFGDTAHSLVVLSTMHIPAIIKIDRQTRQHTPNTTRARAHAQRRAGMHACNSSFPTCCARPSYPECMGLSRAGSLPSNLVRESRGGWAGKAEHLPSGSVACLHPSGSSWIGARPVLARPSALARLSSARFATAAK